MYQHGLVQRPQGEVPVVRARLSSIIVAKNCCTSMLFNRLKSVFLQGLTSRFHRQSHSCMGVNRRISWVNSCPLLRMGVLPTVWERSL